MIDKQYNRWMVIDKGSKPDYYLCVCSCGTKREVYKYSLTRGKSTSCGCYLKEFTKSTKTTHGMRWSEEYAIWKGIKARCNNPNIKAYHRYGGRGIKIDQIWNKDFMAFYNHVGKRPSKIHSIDRIDNNGNYEPGNVRWATPKEQNSNTRTNRYITADYQGEPITDTVAGWGKRLGLSRSTISQRLHAYGWDEVRAVTTPLKKRTYYAP